ncbi:unnamed protein product [Kuraishia capsulata CBS 1993]|uniref:Intimal thickness related receptor IRP domain-containing protein n=1 Tax=Kuraishia capsulata CBS 1993 TaxID=1382522 RepID=W6MP50_9ASCO|nr:uncharacterized protein KUCA_T00004013001 [Kuraishia capsulata CBS 1993]CDK28033.1 unnamed protein product [Kuraishia capsulata CBS 1993]
MRLQRLLFLVLCTLASSVLAEKVLVTNESPQFCTGMYSKRDWDGDIEPHIEVNLQYFKSGDDNVHSSLSVVIFEYSDMDALGVKVSDIFTHYVCSEELVAKGLCDTSELYQFIVNKNVTPKAEILTSFLTSYGDNGLRYNIPKTGYYCVACSSPLDLGKSQNEFIVQVNFQNSYGNLPAAEIPKLKFYGLLAVLYAVSLSVYLFQLFIHRSELLKLQKCLAGVLVYLTLESTFKWFLFSFLNHNQMSQLHPSADDIVFYEIWISLLSVFRTSFALSFLVLISVGYDAVYPKLIPKCRGFMVASVLTSCCYLMYGCFFIVISYFNTIFQIHAPPDSNNNSVAEVKLWVNGIVCAWSVMSCHYLAFSGLSETKKVLANSKQHTKLKLYQRLFWILVVNMLLLITTAIILMFLKISNSFTEFRSLRSLFDFCTSYLFLIVFTSVVFLFRPSHELYLLSLRDDIPEYEVSGELHAVSGGNDFEFDDLDKLESAKLIGSSCSQCGDIASKLDSSWEPHTSEHERSLPPPNYCEHEDKESVNGHRFS